MARYLSLSQPPISDMLYKRVVEYYVAQRLGDDSLHNLFSEGMSFANDYIESVLDRHVSQNPSSFANPLQHSIKSDVDRIHRNTARIFNQLGFETPHAWVHRTQPGINWTKPLVWYSNRALNRIANPSLSSR